MRVANAWYNIAITFTVHTKSVTNRIWSIMNSINEMNCDYDVYIAIEFSSQCFSGTV